MEIINCESPFLDTKNSVAGVIYRKPNMPVNEFLDSASALSWTEDPINTVAVHNTAVTLRCAFDGSQHNSYPQWQQIRDPPLSTRIVSRGANINTEECSTCSLSGDHGNGEFYLTINPVNVNTDEGLWECAAFGATPSTKSATLTVLDQDPVCPNNNGNNKVINGTTVTLTCNLNKAAPPGELVWMINGVDTNVKGNRPLQWNKLVTRSNANNRYNCRYSHGTLTQSRTCDNDFVFDVQYAPEVTIPSLKHVTEGETLSIDCTVDSNPPTSSITWWKGNTEISSSYQLRISNIDKDESGRYVCKAKNQLFTGTQTETGTTTVEVQ
ncbi:cell adhesion molecule 4-like, partial [Saccoglossus kowalevskii]|uniref:Cell adhesion molecule 2-like n=1 Tax=Saccoglossus kowalevskii TaxID=10224 RepID=A0ABM0MQX3_SACKO